MEPLLPDLLLIGSKVGCGEPGARQRVVHGEDGRVVRLVGAPCPDCVKAAAQRVEVGWEGGVVGRDDWKAPVLQVDQNLPSWTVRLVLEGCKFPGGSGGLWRDGVVEKGDVLVAAILLEDSLLAGIGHGAIRAGRLAEQEQGPAQHRVEAELCHHPHSHKSGLKVLPPTRAPLPGAIVKPFTLLGSKEAPLWAPGQ